MKNLSGILSAICLLPTASHAADIAFGDLEPYGEVALHRLSDSNFNQHYWSGDFGVRLKPKDDAKPMNFGFYVGYEGLGFFENLDDIESTSDIGYPTAAAIVRSGAHQFSFGVPRSVIGDTFDREDRVGNLLLDFETGLFTDSVRYARLFGRLIGGGNETIYGVRYDTTWNNTSLSSGFFWGEIYYFEDYSIDTRIFQAAAEHQIGNISFRVAFEHEQSLLSTNILDYSDSVHDSNYSIGATAVSGKFVYGLDLTSRNEGDFNQTYLDVFGTYKVNENLMASVNYVRVATDAWESSLSSIVVEFTPSASSFIRVSTTHDDDFSGNSAFYEASVGIRF